jgi:hypothetical protein
VAAQTSPITIRFTVTPQSVTHRESHLCWREASSRFFWRDVGELDKEWQAEYEARRSRQEPRLNRRTPIYAGHGTPIALIDFFNSREDAILFCTVAILAFVVSKDPRGIGAGFLGVLRTLCHPKLLLLFGSAALYCALIVVAGMLAGLWHTGSLKPTIYWFVGIATVLAGYAVTRSPSDPRLEGCRRRPYFRGSGGIPLREALKGKQDLVVLPLLGEEDAERLPVAARAWFAAVQSSPREIVSCPRG